MQEAIKTAVKKAGSQAKLAVDLGVSQQFIGKAVQQGWLPMDKAKIVNDMYGLPLVELVRSDIADAMRLASKNA